MLKNMKIKTKLIVANAIVLMLFGIIGVIVYVNIEALVNNSKWVDHTHEVIDKGNTLVAEMVNMETGMRGFLVGGKDSFLEPYESGKRNFSDRMAEAKEQVSDNPDQVKRLSQIEELANKWDQNAAAVQISEKRKANEGAESLSDFRKIRSRVIGKQIFDGIRISISKMDAKFKRAKNTEGQLAMNRVLLDLVNMETGQRGFLLTGEEASLDPYIQGQKDFNQDISSLNKMIARGKGSGVTANEIKELQSMADLWKRKAADPEIEARREMNQFSTTMDDVADLVEKGAGKEFMDALRAKMDEFLTHEKSLLVKRAKSSIETANLTKDIVIYGILLTMLIGGIISTIVTRAITRPLARSVDFAQTIADKNLKKTLDVVQEDEIGDLVKALNFMTGELKTMMVEIGDNSLSLESSSTELSAIATQISSNSDKTAEKSNSVASAAEQMNANMTSVASAMEEATSNVDTVASASEEMNTAIEGLVRDVEAAKAGTDEAVASAESVLKNVKDLGADAEEIGTVTETIAAISDKTNLLALNATIEAARAGEAGKGFAVVASEIKELANQTATATTDIGHKLKGIQNSTGTAVTGVEEIANIIRSLNDTVMSVRETMTQQRNATQEISENISQVSLGISEINQNVSQTSEAVGQVTTEINEVNQSASEMGLSNSQLTQTAEELSKMATQLKVKMDQFEV